MPGYSFEAMTPAGVIVRGQGVFASLEALFEHLESKNHTLISYKKNWFAPSAVKGGKIKRLVMAEFLKNLALLTRGGVHLRQAVEDMANSPGEPVMQALLKRILEQLDQGMMLSEAIEKEKRFFPKIVMVLAAIGEETGNLDKTLEDAAEHIYRVDDIIKSTKRALTYPIFVLVAMFGALAFWLLYVLPQILTLFKSLGLKTLPLATRILIASVDITQKWWPVVPIFAAALFTVWLITKKNKNVKLLWDKFWMKTPLIGTVMTCSQLAFLFEYLALLTSSGIQIIRGLELMEQSLNNLVISNGVKGIREGVLAGGSLSDGFQRMQVFEPFILRMVSVGEQTGNMPDQLLILARHYSKKVNALVEALSKTLEPILIVFAGAIFMVIALGLLGPIYDMMGQIK